MTLDKVDIGVLTVREDEFDAFVNRLPDHRNIRFSQFCASYTCLPSRFGEEIRIAVCKAASQGQLAAFATASQMIQALSPDWLILVGIAGGLPSSEYSLGDVVVAKQFTDYSLSALVQDEPPEFSATGGRMHPDVELLLSRLPNLKAIKGWNWQRAIGMKKPHVDLPKTINSKLLYGTTGWRKEVLFSLQVNFPPDKKVRAPRLRLAPVISSNSLLKDADLASRLRKISRHAEAVEMELAGVFAAAHNAVGDHRVMAIRGISDIVGFKRSDEWIRFACKAAASFLLRLIQSGEITARASFTDGDQEKLRVSLTRELPVVGSLSEVDTPPVFAREVGIAELGRAHAESKILGDFVSRIDQLCLCPEKDGIQVTDLTGMQSSFANWTLDKTYLAILKSFSDYSNAYRRKFGIERRGVIRTFIVEPSKLDLRAIVNLERTLRLHIQLGIGARVVLSLAVPEGIIGDLGLYHGKVADEFLKIGAENSVADLPKALVVEKKLDKKAFGDIQERLQWIETELRNRVMLIVSEGELSECIDELRKHISLGQ